MPLDSVTPSMSTYRSRPWLSNYPADDPADIVPEHATMLSAFAATVASYPERVALRYFDQDITFAQLDERTDSLATALIAHGFTSGDRLALYVQNDPSFVYGLVAAWKAGGIGVAVNPMNKARELTYLLNDSGASMLLCLDELYRDVVADVIDTEQFDLDLVITVSGFDDQTRDDARVLPGKRLSVPSGTVGLHALLERYRRRGPSAAAVLSGDDIAVITYTSGTTGEPKGAMNTHRGMAFNAQTFQDWCKLTHQDVILGVAPLFHITGLVGYIALMLQSGSALVLNHRFHQGVMLDALRETKPTFTVGAITVFINLANVENHSPADWSSLRAIYSGGAPIPAAVTEEFAAKTGKYIHSVYGLTETTSPSHAVPLGQRAPVDPESGALSVGVPVFNTTSRILDDNGEELPPGEVGEITIAGPQVVPGYWNKPEETARSMPGGELRTGDVGFMDQNGWFYVVDRKKDMINASGYKVWPREVEDVLYGHSAVAEVAVVGVPDPYRGETVKAFVALKTGASATATELQEFCKERMAAYKYPRLVELVSALPKTASGKILRRELRDGHHAGR